MTTTDNGQLTIDHWPDPAALRLPFDQYGRYRMIREAVDAARPHIAPRLRLLDVGGFFRTARGQDLLPAQVFLPNDDVTVLDQVEADLPSYVRGDGRRLQFADAAFDMVLSCDTLEHVPAANRPAFWQELLRVARHGVILTAPFASPEVVAAEQTLFAYIQAELGVEQPQLKEHRDYGLPEIPITAALLDELGLPYRVYPSGYVHAWLVMMLVKHTRQFGDPDVQEQIDAYYSQFFGPDERREPAYRHFFVVARTSAAPWLDAVDAALAPTIRPTDAPGGAGWLTLASGLSYLFASQRDAQQIQAIATQAQTILTLQQTLTQRDAHIRDLEQRADWLDAQATTARQALHAVEQGRLLRLLQWFQRRAKP